MGEFLNTAVGSYIKVFLAVFLTLVMNQMSNGLSILSLDWSMILNGAVLALLPVIINALNPSDNRYGKKDA